MNKRTPDDASGKLEVDRKRPAAQGKDRQEIASHLSDNPGNETSDQSSDDDDNEGMDMKVAGTKRPANDSIEAAMEEFETNEKKKREMNAVYSRRKREKKKTQIAGWCIQREELQNENNRLRREVEHHQKLVAEAQTLVARIEELARNDTTALEVVGSPAPLPASISARYLSSVGHDALSLTHAQLNQIHLLRDGWSTLVASNRPHHQLASSSLHSMARSTLGTSGLLALAGLSGQFTGSLAAPLSVPSADLGGSQSTLPRLGLQNQNNPADLLSLADNLLFQQQMLPPFQASRMSSALQDRSLALTELSTATRGMQQDNPSLVDRLVLYQSLIQRERATFNDRAYPGAERMLLGVLQANRALLPSAIAPMPRLALLNTGESHKEDDPITDESQQSSQRDVSRSGNLLFQPAPRFQQPPSSPN